MTAKRKKPTRRSDKTITGNDFIARNKLKKYAVRDDGRCWLYVIMTRLGMYNAKPKRGLCRADDPSADERAIAQNICESISSEFPDIVKEPDYDGHRPQNDFMGTYGGLEQWQALTERLPIAVVLWDCRDKGKLMKDPKEKFWMIENINGKGILRHKTAEEIDLRVSTLPHDVSIVHAAWSNTIDAHFDLFM